MTNKARASSADLIQKLLATPTFKSLQIEREIATRLVPLKWQVINGVFYSDPKEHKPRELDVVASQFWIRTNDYGEQLLRLYLVIECKSIKDFHILISPQLQPVDPVIAHHHWFGFETQIVGRLLSQLDQLNLSKEQLNKLRKKLREIAYPNDFARTGDFRIEPPIAQLQTSAFRETNIGSEKELDNSVLWRATQSLRSAVTSFNYERLERNMDICVYPEELTGLPKQKTMKDIINAFTRQTNEIDIWHPIIVLDSSLWLVKKANLEPVDWFRLDLLDFNKHRDWWCDVVTRSSFNSYVKNLTKYYTRSLESVGAKPFKI